MKFTIYPVNERIKRIIEKKKRETTTKKISRKHRAWRKWPASLAPNSLFATYIIRSLSLRVPDRSGRLLDEESKQIFRRESGHSLREEKRDEVTWGRVKGHHHPRFQQEGGSLGERKGFHPAAPILQPPPPFGRRLPPTVHLTRALSGTRTVHCRIESSGLEYSGMADGQWPLLLDRRVCDLGGVWKCGHTRKSGTLRIFSLSSLPSLPGIWIIGFNCCPR